MNYKKRLLLYLALSIGITPIFIHRSKSMSVVIERVAQELPYIFAAGVMVLHNYFNKSEPTTHQHSHVAQTITETFPQTTRMNQLDPEPPDASPSRFCINSFLKY